MIKNIKLSRIVRGRASGSGLMKVLPNMILVDRDNDRYVLTYEGEVTSTADEVMIHEAANQISAEVS